MVQITIIKVVHWTFVYLDGPNQRNIGGPLHYIALGYRPFGWISFVHFDGPKNSIWTVGPSSFREEVNVIKKLADGRLRP